MQPIPYPSPRVSQLDADILDNELLSLLKEQVTSVFSLHTNPNSLIYKLSINANPEFYSLLLNVLIFKYTIWNDGSSYGSKLQNLKLTDLKTGKIITKNKKISLLVILIGTYLFKRLETHLYGVDQDGPTTINESIFQRFKNSLLRNRMQILNKLNNSFKILNLINFTIFLVNGKYPSLIHRILSIIETPISSDLLKFNGSNVNYEFQNRQLVWNVMTEFLVFILPLLQLRKFNRLIRKVFGGTNNKDSFIEINNKQRFTKYTNLPISQCAICHEINQQASLNGGRVFPSLGPITNPYITNCGHIYCYVCLATKFNQIKLGSEDLPCLRCSTKLEWFEEYGIGKEDVNPEAIIIEDEEKDKDEDDESDNESINSVEDFDPDEKIATTKIERQLSHRSEIFNEDKDDSSESDSYSEDEEIDAEEVM